jgi:high-affinity nickel-transport protein
MMAAGGNLVAIFRSKTGFVVGSVILLNVASWLVAFMLFGDHPLLLGSAVLAYGFGLRHAVDADHIAAIDNVTRKLMQEGKRPVGVGLFFSLGHSTIVIGLSLALATMAARVKGDFAALANFGGLVGMTVSSAFLLALAAMNLAVFAATLRTFRRARKHGYCEPEDLKLILAKRGLAGRLFLLLFRLVDSSWHMYPIGLLFGLGFDTATEIGVLGLSAAEGTRGLAIWAIMIFPALFTAGMSLIDTADSLLMCQAYNWAFVKPMRKLYYNLTITGISVAIALGVGGVEALAIFQDHWNLPGAFWRNIALVSGNFTFLGYFIVGLFVVSWTVSVLIYKWRGYDGIEVKTAE